MRRSMSAAACHGVSMTKHVLVTGATGFVGRALCEALTQRGMRVRAATRTPCPTLENAAEICVVGEIGSRTDWNSALEGVDWVMHLAARAHVLAGGKEQDAVYREVNTLGTAALAAAAARSGATRFVYLSTVKVNGDSSAEVVYTSHDEPRPSDAYALSKWQGELALQGISPGSQMQCSTVRSPLVYGTRVRANFLRLMRWVDRGVPLPFGAVSNRRSLISVWNLSDALIRVAEHRAAGGRVWMVSDGADLSTPDLVRGIGRAMGRRVRLVSVPVGLLRLAGTLSARRAEVDRLCGSLVVDISETRSQLDWSPPFTLQASLDRTVASYLEERSDGR
jgi:nucleoside-diphosphate-sugar epimerase